MDVPLVTFCNQLKILAILYGCLKAQQLGEALFSNTDIVFTVDPTQSPPLLLRSVGPHLLSLEGTGAYRRREEKAPNSSHLTNRKTLMRTA